jgi:NAD(P)-dependent dehydrogenase (short-subunit alcohol dehydrogenase family)
MSQHEPASTSGGEFFSVAGRTALITGGSGTLGSALARGLAQAGARVVVASRRAEVCQRIAEEICGAGGQAIGIGCDVLERATLERAATESQASFGPVEILINAAGGNQPQATTGPDASFFDLDIAAVNDVLAGNFTGVFQSCQVFGRRMAEQGEGCIINVASLSALRPLTRVVAYGAAKAAVANFTQWLAVHMAQEYSPRIRVNAVAPGFFLTEQNRFLLTEADGGRWTPRGQAIVAHTPMRRLGKPEDLLGTALWLASPASTFVTGVVVPVDGGFAAYSGV